MPVFPDSAGLRGILEKEGWTLFERIEADDNPAMEYHRVERRGPAAQNETGKKDYFLPTKLGIRDVIDHVPSPTLFIGRQVDLGKFCTLEFQPGKVLVHALGRPIELPNAEVISIFREGFCKKSNGGTSTK